MKIIVNGKAATVAEIKRTIRHNRAHEKCAARVAAENKFWADFAQKMEHGVVPYIRAGEAHAARVAAEQAADEARFAASKAFEAEEADGRAARLTEAVEVFQQMLADQKAAEEAARKEKAEIARLLQEDKKAEKAAAKKARKTANKKAAEARSFDREEARLRKERLMEAVGIFVVDEDAKDKAAEVANVPATGKEEAIASIVERIKNCSTLDASIREQIEKIWLRKQELGYEKVKVDRHILEMAIVYRNYGFDEAPLSVRRSKMVAHIDCAIAELNYELRRIKAIKLRVQQEQRALKLALKYIALNKVDAPYVTALADKCRVAVPKKPSADIRIAAKIPEKMSTPNYRALSVSPKVLYKDLKAERDTLAAFSPKFDDELASYYGRSIEALTEESREKLDKARAVRNMLECKIGLRSDPSIAVLADKPIVVNYKDTTVTHLPQTLLTQCLGIDCANHDVFAYTLVADHKTESWFASNWMVWGDTEPEAEMAYAAFCKKAYEWLEQRGVTLLKSAYRTHSASAQQLKDEKVLMLNAKIRKGIEDVLYFGKTEEQFSKENPVLGPELWKAWANLGRPWTCDVVYADGTIAKPRDILVMKMPQYVYHHKKAICIGELYDKLPYKIGPMDKANDLFAGQILFWKQLKGQGGQMNGYGLKGFAFYAGGSVLRKFLEKNHLTMDEFMNCKVQNIDGKWVRIGDYAGIATDDIWKFDKFFRSWDEYLTTVDQLSVRYPVVGKLGLLRQSEDEEGQYKRRHMTRSLFQQFFNWKAEEVTRLVRPSARKIKALMSYDQAIVKLAGLTKESGERTNIERLFGVAPFLFAAPNVQKHWMAKLRAMVKDLMANRLDAKGQYPYIVQDPVAMLEILTLGKKPEEAGVLPNGYLSVADVPDDTKVLALRFPANFLTSRVRVNKAMRDVFADLGNICVLSIHDDILIVQDGDTDGDEMCILYDELAIELVERMVNEIDPPVVLFTHGSKKKGNIPGNIIELRNRQANARYMASHNDHTGIYADLARNCAMLAAQAKALGNEELFEKYLIWMAAASTGAIISIDQVKGTDVNPVLEAWLAEIQTQVSSAMGYKKPYTQQFLKKDVGSMDCNGPWKDALPDAIALEVREQVGPYKAEMPFVWDVKAAKTACLVHVPNVQVAAHKLSDNVKDFIKSAMYGEPFVTKTGKILDEEFRKNWETGEVTLKQFVAFLYHNKQALTNICEGVLLSEKTEEYYTRCWTALREFALTDTKPCNSKTAKNAKTLVNGLYRTLVNEALELERNNGAEDDGENYAWFCLNVIAAPLTATIRKNGWDPKDFGSKDPAPASSEDLDSRLDEFDEFWGSDQEQFYSPAKWQDEPDSSWLEDEKVSAA